MKEMLFVKVNSSFDELVHMLSIMASYSGGMHNWKIVNGKIIFKHRRTGEIVKYDLEKISTFDRSSQAFETFRRDFAAKLSDVNPDEILVKKRIKKRIKKLKRIR